jgi:hypothetical protein
MSYDRFLWSSRINVTAQAELTAKTAQSFVLHRRNGGGIAA